MNEAARPKRRESQTSACKVRRTEGGHPPVGGQATDRVGEGLTIGPDPQVGLDRRELRITVHYDRR